MAIYSLNTTHEKPQTSIKAYMAIQWRNIRMNYMEVIEADKVDDGISEILHTARSQRYI